MFGDGTPVVPLVLTTCSNDINQHYFVFLEDQNTNNLKKEIVDEFGNGERNSK